MIISVYNYEVNSGALFLFRYPANYDDYSTNPPDLKVKAIL